jgi:23S rRNA (cytosine1962-C5)-methyltransferase
VVPCVIFEDEHLLVANKPAGLNTHAPAPYAGEGLYDWLRHREARWAALAILHRLDQETSGVIVFGKTPRANRSLTAQFTQRGVRKKYLLATDRAVPRGEFTVVSQLARVGDRYATRPGGGERAETRFRVAEAAEWPTVPDHRGWQWVTAEPVTGRTHQIRVQAAAEGFPILGDVLYGGAPAARVFLHAAELTLRHPVNGELLTFKAAPDFMTDPAAALRAALVAVTETTVFRLCHGAADDRPGWYVDRLDAVLLAQSEAPLEQCQLEWILALSRNLSVGQASRLSLTARETCKDSPGLVDADLLGQERDENGDRRDACPTRGDAPSLYHKRLSRRVRGATAETLAPQWVAGELVPARFVVRENGVSFELSFVEGHSTGLFLDQRDNRRRLLTGHVAAGFELSIGHPPAAAPATEVLNLFAYTCGFSVCAALAGARVTSVDLSRKYLDWGRRNFALNGLDAAKHDFIFGDAFDWLKRLAKKGRAFDVVLLDPPTFSASKAGGVFQAERDYGRLIAATLPVLKPGGVLFASTNAAAWPPADFLATVQDALRAAGRRVEQEHYFPQPPDFPVCRAEPAYLKTVWLRVA